MSLFCVSMLFTGCKKDEVELKSEFTLISDGAEFDGETLRLKGERHTVSLEVATEDATGRWDARCPTDDLWLSFSKKAGRINVTVSDNDSDESRKSHITIVLDDNKKTIQVEQDYIRKLRFATSSLPVGAGQASYSMNVITNILPQNLNFRIEDGNGDPAGADFWLKYVSFSNGTVNFSVTRNESEDNERTAKLIAYGDDTEAELVVTQKEASGGIYKVPLDAIDYDFENEYIYDIWDDVASKKVGIIAREYLFKATSEETVIRTVGVVAYPVDKNGNVDHSNGLVIATLHHKTNEITANGGSIMWNSDITETTRGHEMIASYTPGSLSVVPTTIYWHFGATTFSTDPLPTEDETQAVTATLKPWIVTDTRSGDANTVGQTTEEYEYPIVKIGTQYWFAANLKTSRFANGDNIKTNVGHGSGSDWASLNEPMCCINGYLNNDGSAKHFEDANNQDPEAVQFRNAFGIIYNMFTAARITLGDNFTDPITATLTDAISPEGWTVPEESGFRILAAYIQQLTADTNNDPLLELQLGADEDQYGNVTRFNGHGRRYHGNTGGNSAGTWYATMTYNFSGTAGSGKITEHKFWAMHTGTDGTYTTFQEFEIRRGSYIRCIQKK